MAEGKKKIKIIIAVLLVLFLLSAVALSVRVIYLNYCDNSSTTVIVPGNIIGEETTATTVPYSSETTDPSESTGTDETVPESSSTNNPGSSESDATEQSSENTENETTVSESSSSSESSENIGITSDTETKATFIELYKGQPSDNEKFQVINMFPGDTEVKYFAVKVSHHADVIVYFDVVVTEQTKKLANALHIKITHLENGKVLYDGTFADMDANGYGELFATNEKTETIAYYKIEVSLPTSAENKYQAARLSADFEWLVQDTEVLDPPHTGDNSNIILWFILMIISFVMILILLFFRRKKREEEEQNAI